MNDKNEIIRLCGKSGFQPADLVNLRNLYHKYINSGAAICLSCPSSLQHYVKVFQANKDNMLKKIDNGTQ